VGGEVERVGTSKAKNVQNSVEEIGDFGRYYE
jgi:hypothetical protein